MTIRTSFEGRSDAYAVAALRLLALPDSPPRNVKVGGRGWNGEQGVVAEH